MTTLLAPEAPASTIDLPHFRFHLTHGTAGATRRLAEVAESRYQALCAPIGACDVVTDPIDVWLAEDAEAFASAFPDGSPMSEWAVGVTFVGKNRVVLRAHGSALFSLLETFDHELSHVLLHGMAAREKLPRWFSEGVAIWQAGEGVLDRLVDAQRATLTANLILAPVALLGTWIGVKAHRRMNERLFFGITYVALGITGIKLVWEGLT